MRKEKAGDLPNGNLSVKIPKASVLVLMFSSQYYLSIQINPAEPDMIG